MSNEQKIMKNEKRKNKERLFSNCCLLLVIFYLLFVICSCENPFFIQQFDPKTATFESNGGSHVPSQTVYRTYPIRPPANPSKSGFIFDAWYSDNETFQNKWNFKTVANADVTLYAKWNPTTTLTKTVSITILTQPKLDYTHGDSLDLSALKVKIAFDDGTEEDVEFKDFASYGITTSLAHGTVLSYTGHLQDSITVSCGGQTVETADLNMSRAVIPNAAITITAPVKGAIPATTATGTGNFTIGTVSWTPSDNPFKGSMQYTARVTLRQNTNYEFADPFPATINGNTATVIPDPATGNVTLSYTFPETNIKEIASITIKTPPTKLTYTHGEALNLSGLVIIVTYDDGSIPDDISFSPSSGGISTTPANGTTLSHSTHNNATITITYGGKTATTSALTVTQKELTIASATHTKTYDGTTNANGVTVTLSDIVSGDTVSAGTVTAAYTIANAETKTINITAVALTGAAASNYTVTMPVTITMTEGGITKADPSIAWPTASAVIYGAVLSTSTLNGGSAMLGTTPVQGSFAWTTPSTIITASGSHSVTFTPSDTTNYNTATNNVSVPVNCTVTFNTDGGSAAPAIQTIAIGGTATAPTAPTKSGYTFDGWYTSPTSTTAYNFSTPVTGNITLTARWSVPSVFNVTNAPEWTEAVTAIRDGRNSDHTSYTINVTNYIIISGSIGVNTFGNRSDITVAINGVYTITLSGQGNLLRISANQTVSMKDLNLIGNTNNNNPLVYIDDNGTFNMSGSAKVSDNGTGNGSKGYGVGVYGGTFTMTDNASVSNNGSGISSGGVYMDEGTFTMSGNATVSGNKAELGGGVTLDGYNASFTMSGNAKVSGNKATIEGGGVYTAGTFTMNGGTVSSNEATNGGGVYVDGTFTMTGGTIGGTGTDANKATYGGGVYVRGGTFTMNGGNVLGNTATTNGGGAYVTIRESFIGAFTMSGTASVSGNKAASGGGVYMDGGTFTMSDTASVLNNTATKNGGGVTLDTSDSSFTMSGNAKVSGNEGVKGGGVYTAGTFTMNGGTVSGNAAGEGGGVFVLDGTFTMNNSASVSGGNTATYGGGVAMGGGTFTMNDTASVSGNEASAGGGGVYVGSGNFRMYGGEVKGNEAANGGGGVYVDGGTFSMPGGTVSGNTATNGGGVYISDGSFNMTYGYEIPIVSGNTAVYGGGVWLGDGSFSIYLAGIVYGINEDANSNTATGGTGAALYISGSGTATYDDGKPEGETTLSTTNNTIS